MKYYILFLFTFFMHNAYALELPSCMPIHTSYGVVSFENTVLNATLVMHFTKPQQVPQYVQLQTIGPGNRCIKFFKSEISNYIFLEFENGAAGTSTLISEKYLYIFSIGPNGLTLLKKEQLEEKSFSQLNQREVISSKHYLVKSPSDPSSTKPIVEIQPVEPSGKTITISY